MSSRERWRGRLFMGHGRLVYVGPAGSTARHAHHAFQIVLAGDQPLLLSAEGERPQPCKAALIPPDAPHAIDAPAASAVMIYVDPDGAAGRRLQRLVVPRAPVDAWRRAAEPRLLALTPRPPESWADADRLAGAVIDQLVPDDEQPRPVHPAITRVLRALPDLLDRPVRLKQLAAHGGLSPGRISHLFTEIVGIPIRPYVLWLRLQHAALHLERGASITESAHAAGFADAAHLNRVFRRMFGVAPSDVVGWVEWITPRSG